MEPEVAEAAKLEFAVKATLCDESTSYVEKTEDINVVVEADASPLAELRDAVRGALGLQADAAVTLTHKREETEQLLSTDALVREAAVELKPGEALDLMVSKITKSVTATQAITVEDATAVSGSETLELNFAYTVGQPKLLAALKQEISGEFEVNYEVELSAEVDGETTPLASDRAFANLLEYLRDAARTTEPLQLKFSRARVAQMVRIKFSVSLLGDTSGESHAVQFESDLDVPAGSLAALRQEVRGELELDPAEDIDVTAIDESGEHQPLPSDKALNGLLRLLSESGKDTAAIRVARKQSQVRKAIQIRALHKTEELSVDATFTFAFTLSDAGILDALKQEIRGELELDGAAKIDLVASIEGDEVPLRSDTQLLGMAEAGVEALEVDVSMASASPAAAPPAEEAAEEDDAAEGWGDTPRGKKASAEDEPSGTARSVSGQCDKTFTILFFKVPGGSESQSLTVKFNPAAPGSVQALIEKIQEGSETASDEPVGLLHRPTGQDAVAVSTDQQVESLFADGGPSGAFEFGDAPPRTTKSLTLIIKVKGTENAEEEQDATESPFSFSPQDVHPLRALRGAIEAAIGKVDWEMKTIGFFVEGKPLTASNDRFTRELLLSCGDKGHVVVQDQQPAEVPEEKAANDDTRHAKEDPQPKDAQHDTLDEIGAAAASTSLSRRRVTLELYYQPSNEHGTLVFEYAVDQEAIVDALKQEIRDEFNARGDILLTLTATVPPSTDPIPVDSDGRFREVVASLEAPAKLSIIAEEQRRTVTKEIYVELRAPAEDEGPLSFTFRYTIGTEGLLLLLKQDCLEAAELDDDGKDYALEAIADERESFALVSDSQLEEVFSNHFDQSTLRLTVVAVKPKEPTKTAKLSLYFEGASVDCTFTFFASQVELLDALKAECRGELELMGNDEITLLFNPSIVEEEVVVDEVALRKLLVTAIDRDEVLKLHVEKGDIRAALCGSLKLQVAKEDSAEEQQFVFEFSSDDDVLQLLRDRVTQAFGVARECFVGLSIAATEQTDAMPILDGDQLVSLYRSGFQDTLLVTAKIVASAANVATLARGAELSALCTEVRDILETRDEVTPTDLRPLVVTFRLDGEPLPPNDPLVENFSAFVASDRAVPYDQVHDMLQDWTGHLADDAFFAFCYHCRNTIDMLVSVSPASKTRRLITSAFKAQSVAGLASKESLEDSLLASGLIEPDDVASVLSNFPPRLTEPDFAEIMTHFFSEHPNRIHTLFSVSSTKRPLSAGKSRGSKEVDALRKSRLRSEVRHAVDGVAPESLRMLKEDFGATEDAWLKELAYCVGALLRLPCSNSSDRDPAWAWLMEACDDGAGLLSSLKMTTRSYATQAVIASVSTSLMSKELTPSLLFPRNAVLAALAEWAARVAQLTCVTMRWAWPPLSTEVPPEEQPMVPEKMQISPPRSRFDMEGQGVVSRSIVQRYSFRFPQLSEGLNLSTERPTNTPLTTLLAEMDPKNASAAADDEDQQPVKDDGGATPGQSTDSPAAEEAADKTDEQEDGAAEKPTAAAAEEEEEPVAEPKDDPKEDPSAAENAGAPEAEEQQEEQQQQDEAPPAAETKEEHAPDTKEGDPEGEAAAEQQLEPAQTKDDGADEAAADPPQGDE